MESKERDIFLQAMDILYAYRLKKYGLDPYFTAAAVYGDESTACPDKTEPGAAPG